MRCMAQVSHVLMCRECLEAVGQFAGTRGFENDTLGKGQVRAKHHVIQITVTASGNPPSFSNSISFLFKYLLIISKIEAWKLISSHLYSHVMIDTCPHAQLGYKMSLILRQTQDQPSRHITVCDPRT